jgi:hypothetical protein
MINPGSMIGINDWIMIGAGPPKKSMIGFL